jgi:large subunit ribosomal protein L15
MAEKRKTRRSRKYLGTRSHGKGNAKNRRGSGSKGGWGRAGMHKHRFSYATTHERDWVKYGGRRGFHNPTTIEVDTINLYEIENKIKSGKISGKFEFKGKILGCGMLSAPVEISAYSASERAIERIKKAGGKFISLKSNEGVSSEGEDS